MTFTNINHQSKIIKLGGSDQVVEDMLRICKSQVRPKTFLPPIFVHSAGSEVQVVQVCWVDVCDQTIWLFGELTLWARLLSRPATDVADVWLEAAPGFGESHNTQNPFLLFLLQTIMRVIGQRFYNCPLGSPLVHLADKLHRTPLSDCQYRSHFDAGFPQSWSSTSLLLSWETRLVVNIFFKYNAV